MNAFTNHDSGRYSAAQGEGGRAAAPAPSRRPNAAQRPRSGPHGGGVTWDRIKALAVKLRTERTPEARMGWALAALLSLPHEGREALIDHLVRTWGRDVLLRRLSKTYDAGGSDHG